MLSPLPSSVTLVDGDTADLDFIHHFIEVRSATVNGQPGFLFPLEGAAYAVLASDIVDGPIQAIRAIANPDKLRAVDAR